MESSYVAFSFKEIKEAGINFGILKYNKVRFDNRRKTLKPANVELLKKMELKPIPTGSGTSKPKKQKAVKKVAAPKAVEPQSDLKVQNVADLTGMTDKFKQKLSDLGITECSKLLEEDVKELSKLTKITQKQIKAWCEEIKGN